MLRIVTGLLIHLWSFKISINQQCGLMAGQRTRSCRGFLGIASQPGPVPLPPARGAGQTGEGDSPLLSICGVSGDRPRLAGEGDPWPGMGMAVWQSWGIAQVGNKGESFSLQVRKGRNAPRYLSGDTEAAPSFRAYELTGFQSLARREPV